MTPIERRASDLRGYLNRIMPLRDQREAHRLLDKLLEEIADALLALQSDKDVLAEDCEALRRTRWAEVVDAYADYIYRQCAPDAGAEGPR